MPNTAVLEPIALEPIAFSPNPDLTDANVAVPVLRSVQTRTTAPWQRTLVRKWDMIAVIALMLASGTYSVYAMLFLTGH